MTTLLYTGEPSRFTDLREAGEHLTTWLTGFRDRRPVVVGIAPEGMPLAAEIARDLGAPLDTVAVQPLTLGPLPEDRFGVAAEGGIALYDPDHREQVDADPVKVDEALVDAEVRLQRRSVLWRKGRHQQSLRGRIVVLVAEDLVDERLAAAAACAVRDRGAAHVVYVARRAELDAVMAMEEWVDEIVGLELIDDEHPAAIATGAGSPVTDQTVQELLRENQNERRRIRRQQTQR